MEPLAALPHLAFIYNALSWLLCWHQDHTPETGGGGGGGVHQPHPLVPHVPHDNSSNMGTSFASGRDIQNRDFSLLKFVVKAPVSEQRHTV